MFLACHYRHSSPPQTNHPYVSTCVILVSKWKVIQYEWTEISSIIVDYWRIVWNQLEAFSRYIELNIYYIQVSVYKGMVFPDPVTYILWHYTPRYSFDVWLHHSSKKHHDMIVIHGKEKLMDELFDLLSFPGQTILHLVTTLHSGAG